MRRIAIAVTLAGIGALVARALAPRLHARLLAKCERMFEQMPESFPPKRMLRGIEEIRANSAKTLELLEEREQAGEAQPRRESPSARPRATRNGRNKGEELATVGPSIREPDLPPDA